MTSYETEYSPVIPPISQKEQARVVRLMRKMRDDPRYKQAEQEMLAKFCKGPTHDEQ